MPRRYLDEYLLPEFGSTVPADISPAMAARLLARVAKKAPTAANDLLRYMRRVFRFAFRRHLIGSNPVADFNLSDAGGKESARQRSLSRDELEKLFKSLRDSPPATASSYFQRGAETAASVRYMSASTP